MGKESTLRPMVEVGSSCGSDVQPPDPSDSMSNRSRSRLASQAQKTVIVTVGLPARGKTFIARRLARYFNWIGLQTEVFNVGNYRRKMYPSNSSASFFDPSNVEGRMRRLKCAMYALNDVCSWLETKGDVAIFDATNSTRERRDMIYKKCCEEHKYGILFVESICDNDRVINNNVRYVKISSPDYKNVPSQEAMQDFNERIQKYKNQYEPIDEAFDEDVPFIKIIDVGQQYVVNNIEGAVARRAVYFLMNIHILPRSIYVSRTGETIGNLGYELTTHSNLSDRGEKYANLLTEFFKNRNIQDLVVWTSEQLSAQETAKRLKDAASVPVETWRALNELDAGRCNSLTYSEIALKYSREFAQRDANKFYFRYPMGESYEDLVYRLEPVIMELERAENVYVVSHHAIGRCILGYFLNRSSAEIPYLYFPLHTLLKLTPTAYGCEIETFYFGIDAVNTHRSKPRNCSISRTIEEALETTPGFVGQQKTPPHPDIQASTRSENEETGSHEEQSF